MPTIESIQTDIDEAVTPGFRARLIARGQARAMIWRDGVLPPGAPDFSPQLSYDLHSYGYSLFELGLRLRELGGDPARARQFRWTASRCGGPGDRREHDGGGRGSRTSDPQ